MALLEVRGVNVHFGGHHALRSADLDVGAGAVTGLIGPNGAGKTTLFNVITGLLGPTGGRTVLDGRDISRLPAHQRARLGMARTFQRLELFGSLTARENILTAAEIARGRGGHRSPHEVTEAVLDQVGIRPVADVPADTLPTGLARLVELGRALATGPRALLLDEPASGLDDAERDALAALLADLAASGIGVLLVEHDVALVMEVCDRVHVLDAGAVLAAGTPAEVQADHAVLTAYLGETAPDGSAGAPISARRPGPLVSPPIRSGSLGAPLGPRPGNSNDTRSARP